MLVKKKLKVDGVSVEEQRYAMLFAGVDRISRLLSVRRMSR